MLEVHAEVVAKPLHDVRPPILKLGSDLDLNLSSLGSDDEVNGPIAIARIPATINGSGLWGELAQPPNHFVLLPAVNNDHPAASNVLHPRELGFAPAELGND